MPESSRAGERILRGIPVSAGVCRGKILVLGKTQPGVSKRLLADDQLAAEVNRFGQALVQTRHDILEIQRQVKAGVGAAESDIFDAHLLVLEDPALIEEATRLIEQDKVSAEFAFHTVAENTVADDSVIERWWRRRC